MKFRVLFTLDYEIQGNGHGSPRKLMVEPTERLLAQLDRHGARLTVMADVAEILRFKRHLDETGRDDFSFEAIRGQLQTAVKTGHDVQLHLHPSYYNSRLVNGHLAQDYAEYDLARLPDERLQHIVREAKGWLEGLLRPVDPRYRCVAFRAANWSMNPARGIVRALADNGIAIDTSVFKHGRRNGMVSFDYAGAHSDLVPWPVDADDVCRRDPRGRVWEFPIYCERRPIWHFVTANRVYGAIQGRLNPLPKGEYEPSGEGARGVLDRLARVRDLLLARHAWKLDFNKCSGRQLVAALRRIEERHAGSDGILPVVLIGHSKLFTSLNEASLEPFLRFVAQRGDRFGFGAFRDFDVRRLAGARPDAQERRGRPRAPRVRPGDPGPPEGAPRALAARARAHPRRVYGRFDAAALREELASKLPARFDALMVHCGLDDLLPMYSQGVGQLLAMLRALCGPARTLAMPAFTYGVPGNDVAAHFAAHARFDAARQPSQMGLLSEVFRRTPGVLRSLHPTHSVCALGPHASALVATHHRGETTFGADSPFARMAELDTVILGLGKPYYRVLTQVHAAEDLLQASYPIRRSFRPVDVSLVDAAGECPYRLLVDTTPLEKRLDRLGRLLAPGELTQWRFHGVELFWTRAAAVTSALLAAARRGETSAPAAVDGEARGRRQARGRTRRVGSRARTAAASPRSASAREHPDLGHPAADRRRATARLRRRRASTSGTGTVGARATGSSGPTRRTS